MKLVPALTVLIAVLVEITVQGVPLDQNVEVYDAKIVCYDVAVFHLIPYP